MSMMDKQKEKAARIPAIGVAGEQPSHMYNKTIIADAVGSDNLQNDEQLTLFESWVFSMKKKMEFSIRSFRRKRSRLM